MNNELIFTILMTISIAGLAFVLAYVISAAATAQNRATENRLKNLNKDGDELAVVKNESTTVKRRKKRNNLRGNSFFDKFGTVVFKELQAAEINMRPEEFMTMWLILATVPSSLVALFTSNGLIAGILAVAFIILPVFFIKKKQKKRVKAFENQLGDALVVCCNCLRSGLSFQQAMETISQDVDAPLGTEFGRCLSEMNLGTSMDDALDAMNERIKSDDLKLLVSAISVQRQTGGNLSEILETISEKIKDRMKMRQEIKAITAQGKMSGILVGSMPIIIGVMFSVVNYDYMRPFFEETRGNIALGVVAGLDILAFIVIKKIISIKV